MKKIPWRKILIPAGVVGVVLTVGVVIWLITHAAGSFVTIEPENGSVNTPAQKVTDSGASGGASVSFSPPASTSVATLNFVTWNIGVNNPRNVGDEVIDLMRFADIMGIQELTVGTAEYSSVDSKVICSSCAYDSTETSHRYDNSSPNKEMIMWKKASFTKLDTGVVDVSPRTTVEGGEVVAPRFINWALLQHKATGKKFYVTNQHVVSGVESGGHPDSSVPKRLALYRTHMNKLTALITNLKAGTIPIFTLGDFNVDYRDDHIVRDPMFPYVRLGAVGAKSSYDVLKLAGIASGAGTRPVSDRLIDYVWHDVRADTTMVSEDISGSTHGSDHYAFYATAEVK